MPRPARLLFVMSIVAAAALWAPRTEAYSALSTDGWDRFRWETDDPVPWTLDPAGSSDIPYEALHQSIVASFETWQSIDCATITFTDAGQADERGDGRIHIYFEEEEWDATVGDAAALTETLRDGRGRILRAAVRFNGVDMRWSVGGGDPYDAYIVDVQAVATHELGHAIGLSHTRERAATMYYAGGDEGARHLHDDDRRGLCYLYPAVPFDDGQACDSCEAHEHCTDGSCLFYPDEGAFCGERCEATVDCPFGYACAAVPGVGHQCLPSNGHCEEVGGNIPLGGYCYGDATCESGVCLVTEGGAFCTQSCDPTDESDESCPGAARCLAMGTVGLCVPPGPLPFGSPCAAHTDCEGTLCLAALDGGVCSQPCIADVLPCPGGAACLSDVCIPTGSRPLGALCDGHVDCATGLCIAREDGEGRCSAECARPDLPCPDGSVCLDYGAIDYCFSAGSQPEGGPCRGDGGCDDDLVCVQADAEATWSRCVRPCDPDVAEPCSAPDVCERVPGTPDADRRGRCVAPTGAAPGEPCGLLPAGAPENVVPCRQDAVCLLTGLQDGVCAALCTAAADEAPKTCPEGTLCAPLPRDGYADLGVCAPTEGAVATWSPGDPIITVNAATPPDNAAALVPIELAERPGGGGCRADARGPARRLDTAAPLLLPLGLLFALLRRRYRGTRTIPV